MYMYWQHEYEASKPARDAAAKAKAEADAEEASLAAEVPLHTENEWNIRSVVNDPLHVTYLVDRSISLLSLEVFAPRLGMFILSIIS